jgi:hypothetical protein
VPFHAGQFDKTALPREIFQVGTLKLVLTADVTRVESLVHVFSWVVLAEENSQGFPKSASSLFLGVSGLVDEADAIPPCKPNGRLNMQSPAEPHATKGPCSDPGGSCIACPFNRKSHYYLEYHSKWSFRKRGIGVHKNFLVDMSGP